MPSQIKPAPSPSRRARPQGVIADPDGRLRQRITALAGELLNAAERIIGRMAAPPPAPDPVLVATRRRQLANTVGAWRFCANNICRRTRCCRRDPVTCLHSVLPLMPEVMVGLLKMRRPKRAQRT